MYNNVLICINEYNVFFKYIILYRKRYINEWCIFLIFFIVKDDVI